MARLPGGKGQGEKGPGVSWRRRHAGSPFAGPHDARVQAAGRRPSRDPAPARLRPRRSPPPAPWWGVESDLALLAGAWRHGYGAWGAVRTDPELAHAFQVRRERRAQPPLCGRLRGRACGLDVLL